MLGGFCFDGWLFGFAYCLLCLILLIGCYAYSAFLVGLRIDCGGDSVWYLLLFGFVWVEFGWLGLRLGYALRWFVGLGFGCVLTWWFVGGISVFVAVVVCGFSMVTLWMFVGVV